MVARVTLKPRADALTARRLPAPTQFADISRTRSKIDTFEYLLIQLIEQRLASFRSAVSKSSVKQL
jgi:hypothetical protein